VLGVLSALPLISGGNICCCLWIVSGGVVAAYFLQQNHPAPITPADGAMVGLLAGVIGAGVYLVVSIPVAILVAPLERRVFERLVETMGNMPPEFREYATNPLSTGLRTIASFFLMLMLGMVFSTIGGLIGAALFGRRKTPPEVIDVTPVS
jgi:hypothetical protein